MDLSARATIQHLSVGDFVGEDWSEGASCWRTDRQSSTTTMAGLLSHACGGSERGDRIGE